MPLNKETEPKPQRKFKLFFKKSIRAFQLFLKTVSEYGKHTK